MEITVERKYFKDKYTIGSLSIDGQRVCDTLKPPCKRGLTQQSPLGDIYTAKAQGFLTIPAGRYAVFIARSEKFGLVPRLHNVPSFEGILIHAGNRPKNTRGCIPSGRNEWRGLVMRSRNALAKVFRAVMAARDRGKDVWITVGGRHGWTPGRKLIPFGIDLNVSYKLVKSLSVLAVTESSWLIPKEGMTKDYNGNFNLGGGLGYIISAMGDKEEAESVFEVRGSVTSSLTNHAYKNTSYKIGLYWRGCATSRRLVPFVGIGYNAKDFRTSGLSTYHGLFASFGFRF